MDALQETPDVARAAEEVGFQGLWANDTKHNPFVTLAMAAMHTTRLELGTGVTVAFARSPVFIAGVNRLLCQLAGEVGDGFIVHPLHSVEYLQKVVLPNIAVGLTRSGRSRDDVTLYAPVFLAPGESPAEVAAAVARARARM